MEPSMFDSEIARVFNSDIEDENIYGLVGED